MSKLLLSSIDMINYVFELTNYVNAEQLTLLFNMQVVDSFDPIRVCLRNARVASTRPSTPSFPGR